MNKHEHYQIPFREGEKELRLLLMSQEKTLSKNEYKELYKQVFLSLK